MEEQLCIARRIPKIRPSSKNAHRNRIFPRSSDKIRSE